MNELAAARTLHSNGIAIWCSALNAEPNDDNFLLFVIS